MDYKQNQDDESLSENKPEGEEGTKGEDYQDSLVKIHHKKWEMASINMGSLVVELIQGVLSISLFYFYEQVLGLRSILAGVAITIYAVYDAFNDPLVGHFTDRVFPWTKKWGRRFPFIAAFFIPMLIGFLLIFTPPDSVQGDDWTLFGWLIFTTCFFDTVESFFTINYWALEPDKFRDEDERRTLGVFEVLFGFLGVVVSFLVPPMIINDEVVSTYATMAWVCVAISFVAYIFLLPGAREDQETIDKYIEHHDEEQKDSFFRSLKFALTHHNFLAFLIMYILYQAMIQLMQGSTLYYATFVLGEGEDVVTFLLLMFFLGGLISIPFWTRFAKGKINNGSNRRGWLFSSSLMVLFSVVLTFMTSLAGAMSILFLYGLGFGGFWVLTTPIYSDVIDEAVVEQGKRKEAIYGGLRQFFVNLARVIQALTLSIVHELTGFVEGANTQSASAVLGIRLHFGLLPALYLLIGIIVFKKIFDLSKDRVQEIKKELLKLGL